MEGTLEEEVAPAGAEQTVTQGQGEMATAPAEPEGDKEYADAFAEFAANRVKGEKINPLPDPLPETKAAPAAKDETQGGADDQELVAFRAEHPEFAELPDSVLSSVKRLDDHGKLMEQRFRSVDGRLQPMQRKVNDLLREANKIRSAQQIGRVRAADDETWKKFTKDYPDIAQAVEQRFASAASPMPETENLTERLSRLEREELKRRRAAEYAALKNAHADYEQVVNGTKFQTWLFNQPEPVQALIKSKRAADAAWLISTFKEHAGLVTKPDPQKTPADTTGKVVDVNAIRQKREQQLVSGRSIGGKPVGHAASGDQIGGFESAFKHFSAQRDQRRAQRGDRYF
jgi:hypothetical protein